MPSLTQEQLKELIKEAAHEAASDQYEELSKKQTAWMETIKEQRSVSADPQKDRSKMGIGAARMVRALAASGGDPDRASRWAKKCWSDDLGTQVEKALAAGDLDAGGFMIPEDFSEEIIEFLYNRSVVRRAGPTMLPMVNGSLTLPKQTGSATASYVGENADISASEPTGGQIIMTAKKLAAMVPISNDLLRFDAGDKADRFVRNDLVQRIAVREDKAFIRDDGTENKPKGLRHWATGANVFDSNGKTYANIELDVKTAINNLESNNISFEEAVWFMAPRSKNALLNLRDAVGNLVYPEIRNAQPTLMGRPVYTTNNIPTNLGSGSDSEVYLVDIANAIVAEAAGLEIEVDRGASYTSGGSLVSAFERDQTVIRAIEQHDFAMRHNEAVTVITGVTWGT